MTDLVQKRRAWCASLANGSKGLGYRVVARHCDVVKESVEQWCLYGFPPARLRQLRTLGERHNTPFDEDLIAWANEGSAA